MQPGVMAGAHALDSASSTSTACCWRAARRGRALARRGDGAEEGRIVGRALEVAQVRVRVAVGVAAHQAAQLRVRHHHHHAAAKPHLRPCAEPAGQAPTLLAGRCTGRLWTAKAFLVCLAVQ